MAGKYFEYKHKDRGLNMKITRFLTAIFIVFIGYSTNSSASANRFAFQLVRLYMKSLYSDQGKMQKNSVLSQRIRKSSPIIKCSIEAASRLMIHPPILFSSVSKDPTSARQSKIRCKTSVEYQSYIRGNQKSHSVKRRNIFETQP